MGGVVLTAAGSATGLTFNLGSLLIPGMPGAVLAALLGQIGRAHV